MVKVHLNDKDDPRRTRFAQPQLIPVRDDNTQRMKTPLWAQLGA